MKLKHEIVKVVRSALDEDIGSGDITAQLIPEQKEIKAQILTRESMCLCGLDWVIQCFHLLDSEIKITFFVNDGAMLSPDSLIAEVHGNARSILSAERTALNFLQCLSATATQTKKYVDELKDTKTKLLDTRKTLPNLRFAQKYAVKCGGGVNHRYGLYDAYLIKENHILACGSIDGAISKARQMNTGQIIEVEVESIEEYQQALLAKPDAILLDNFSIEKIQKAIELRENLDIKIEASGGITLENIKTIANTGVDYVSTGDITKNIRAIDLTLLVRE